MCIYNVLCVYIYIYTPSIRVYIYIYICIYSERDVYSYRRI